ncbi:preprotein translocase subunit YajC [Arthrobacter sp. BF1]|uniref:preprotein translocase subunit YajC n=2 Tax=unclassified Arthrobacter TaxID=235627 RepID=UPI00277D082B|nr:preprotein translocase subunit YajC [Arthrobacter sp. BF1]
MDPMSILLFVMFGLLIFMMMRKQKKAKAAAAEKRSKLAPGVEIMTNFGLFGKVLSIDTEENKILMEISPGTTATVHSQTVAKIIEPADEVEAIVPDDASSLTLNLDKTPDAPESVEDSLERLKNENNKDN